MSERIARIEANLEYLVKDAKERKEILALHDDRITSLEATRNICVGVIRAVAIAAGSGGLIITGMETLRWILRNIRG